MTPQIERASALCELVARPCEFDVLRTHRQTQAGREDRFWLWRDLPMRYVTIQRQERREA